MCCNFVLFVVNLRIGNLEPKEKRKLKGNSIAFDLLNFYIKNVFIWTVFAHVIGFGGESGSSLLRAYAID
jgi:hypothetical protein